MIKHLGVLSMFVCGLGAQTPTRIPIRMPCIQLRCHQTMPLLLAVPGTRSLRKVGMWEVGGGGRLGGVHSSDPPGPRSAHVRLVRWVVCEGIPPWGEVRDKLHGQHWRLPPPVEHAPTPYRHAPCSPLPGPQPPCSPPTPTPRACSTHCALSAPWPLPPTPPLLLHTPPAVCAMQHTCMWWP